MGERWRKEIEVEWKWGLERYTVFRVERLWEWLLGEIWLVKEQEKKIRISVSVYRYTQRSHNISNISNLKTQWPFQAVVLFFACRIVCRNWNILDDNAWFSRKLSVLASMWLHHFSGGKPWHHTMTSTDHGTRSQVSLTPESHWSLFPDPASSKSRVTSYWPMNGHELWVWFNLQPERRKDLILDVKPDEYLAYSDRLTKTDWFKP